MGIPKVLNTNSRKQFDSQALKEFCEKFEIDEQFASIAHLQTNRLAEVTNQTKL